MIQIDNTLLSRDIVEKRFSCNLKVCKGACCIEGDSGAPIDKDERKLLEKYYDKIKQYMSESGRKAVADYGKYYIDQEHDYVTTLVDGKECAYSVFDKTGTAFCAIEKAWNDKKIPFRKPISCFLYPIRVKEFTKLTAVNFDEWDICKSAIVSGIRKNIKLYKFLKEPLIKKFGDDWYKQLEYFASQI